MKLLLPLSIPVGILQKGGSSINTISLSGLRIMLEDLGTEFLVTAVRPYYAYANDQRTDKVEGYKYSTVLPTKGFAKVDIKVPGPQRLDVPPTGYVPVRYDNLDVKLYYDNNNRVQLSAKAMDVHRLGTDKPPGKP